MDSSLLSSSESSLDENAVYDKPMFSFGILTDIQYAPVDDGHSFNGTPRYYRHAKTAAGHAARHFEEEKVQCVLNLGDIIDGKCLHAVNGHRAVDDVLEALSVYKHGRIVHTYGEWLLFEVYSTHYSTWSEPAETNLSCLICRKSRTLQSFTTRTRQKASNPIHCRVNG